MIEYDIMRFHYVAIRYCAANAIIRRHKEIRDIWGTRFVRKREHVVFQVHCAFTSIVTSARHIMPNFASPLSKHLSPETEPMEMEVMVEMAPEVVSALTLTLVVWEAGTA